MAEGRLDICLALPAQSDGEFTPGIYHEKMGVFEDAAGDAVAFAGSANETSGGLLDNFESVDVFWSWDDPHGRVARKKANFARLWTDTTNKVKVYPFPEAARRRLLTFHSRAPGPGGRAEPAPPPPGPPAKWRHHQEAVDKFLAQSAASWRWLPGPERRGPLSRSSSSFGAGRRSTPWSWRPTGTTCSPGVELNSVPP